MTPREHLSVAAPATVANLTVGFDCLGLALERPLERLDLRRTDTPGVTIAAIHGCDGLPLDPSRNVSGKAAQSVLQSSRRGLGESSSPSTRPYFRAAGSDRARLLPPAQPMAWPHWPAPS